MSRDEDEMVDLLEAESDLTVRSYLLFSLGRLLNCRILSALDLGIHDWSSQRAKN